MKQKYHFIGIGGIGMSGLARILIGMGYDVSGSDLTCSTTTDQLHEMGAMCYIGHSAECIFPSMKVVFSSDIKEDNPEYRAAIELKCRMFHRSELLNELMEEFNGLVVTGTHGKTTTSALLSWVLFHSKLEPSFCVGGMMPNFQSNSMYGSGKYFVAEADESDGTFLRFHPFGAIVTNIGLDHLNYYKTEKCLVDAFKTFVSHVENRELLFWCRDDSRLSGICKYGVSYGFSDKADLKCSGFNQSGWHSTFNVSFDGKVYSDIKLNLIGRHNALNATAVFGMALKLGISEQQIKEAFESFQGIGRRCEVKGDEHNILFLDDYAHHPTEIAATLNAVKQAIPGRRLIAAFQPHRYTRTRDCIGQYADIFNDVDQLLITDIHSAGENPIEKVSAKLIINEVHNGSQTRCSYVSRKEIVKALIELTEPNDVIVSMGAGDITHIAKEFFDLKKCH